LDLKIRSDKKRGVFIEDITEKYISSPDEVYQLIEIARNCRSIAATNMNERSSRSHMIFILTISQDNTADLSAKTGKLYLVDLAGSEKISKTGAEGKVLD
jgi:kinesin family protein 5